MNAKKNYVIALISLLFCFFCFEILFGYYQFSKEAIRANKFPATWNLVKKRLNKPLLIRKDNKDIFNNKTANPFITYDSEPGYKFHPFIDYSGVHSNMYSNDIKLDYFGFRNNSDLYFKKGDNKLVVITGGSEAAGYTHKKTIAALLEDILNKESGHKFKVLNLAMNSYCIMNEINSYVNLAYNLKPEFVITHTGWNDILLGLHVPYNFKKLGLNYMKKIETWLPRFYDLETEKVKLELNLEGDEVIVETFYRNMAKYKQIVQNNQGIFIAGIQSYNRHLELDDETLYRKTLYNRTHSLYEKLESNLPGWIDINFSQFKDINFIDSIHTDDVSAGIIARAYAELILSNLGASKTAEGIKD